MIEEDKITTYTITQKYGMEGVGDFELEWLTPKEKEVRLEKLSNYIEQVKLYDKYGKEWEMKIGVKYDPHLDK